MHSSNMYDIRKNFKFKIYKALLIDFSYKRLPIVYFTMSIYKSEKMNFFMARNSPCTNSKRPHCNVGQYLMIYQEYMENILESQALAPNYRVTNSFKFNMIGFEVREIMAVLHLCLIDNNEFIHFPH